MQPEPVEIFRNATSARATVLIALLAVGCLLYLAQVAFIPVAIALFLSSLLTPAVDLLHRWHLPRGLGAILVVALVLFAGVAGIDAVGIRPKPGLTRRRRLWRESNCG